MKKIIIGGLAALAIALGTAPAVHANYDPHIQIPPYWCPGGGIFSGYGGYCEGPSYPDGTRWNFNQVMGFIPPMKCVVFTGQPNPPLAGPGGCGGAV